MPHLGVALLAVRQAHGEAGRGDPRPDPSAASRSSAGVLARLTALPGPAGAMPNPSMTTRTRGPCHARQARADDGGERVRVEARAAHQGAVDVGLPQQLGRRVGRDAAAVEDAQGGAVHGLAGDGAHQRARLLGDLRGGGAAGADRPDRLVGDREDVGRPRLHARQAGPHLGGEPRLRLPRLALVEGLAAAHDHREPGVERRRRAGRHLVVGLARGPALGVPHDRAGRAGGEDHRGGDLAGVRARGLLVHGLGQHADGAARRGARGRLEGRERRAHRHLGRRLPLAEVGAQAGDVLPRLHARLVHLPVPRDQRAATTHAVGRAATPGRVLPSSISRAAPPPVETWV